ncbi:CAP domain-containing protein [Nonomuraea sp. GTA35]|uniref:CAP domain-containing protein n=1 Tax=Nonomuraea sp. GTA35 TaxID=1676746 RepID=UPI0035C0990E
MTRQAALALFEGMSHDRNPPRPAQRHHAGMPGEALAEANAYRAKHHAPPLVMDPELDAYALERASSRSEQEMLAAGRTGLRAQTGENIFWGGDAEALPGSKAVKKWYDEIAAKDFTAARFSSGAGHFTQLVWKPSTKVGVAGQPGDASRRTSCSSSTSAATWKAPSPTAVAARAAWLLSMTRQKSGRTCLILRRPELSPPGRPPRAPTRARSP